MPIQAPSTDMKGMNLLVLVSKKEVNTVAGQNKWQNKKGKKATKTSMHGRWSPEIHPYMESKESQESEILVSRCPASI